MESSLSMATAIQLKAAGIEWKPEPHDFFSIPDVEMDDKIFALSDMTVSMEVLDGYHAITFVGAVEWALDFIYHSDAVWLPTESQLRGMIVDRLGDRPSLTLQTSIGGYVVTVDNGTGKKIFEGVSAVDAYAAALLELTKNNR